MKLQYYSYHIRFWNRPLRRAYLSFLRICDVANVNGVALRSYVSPHQIINFVCWQILAQLELDMCGLTTLIMTNYSHYKGYYNSLQG